MRPEIAARQTPFNRRVLEKCTKMRSEYVKPALLFTNHLETIWAVFARQHLNLELRRGYVETEDGGVVTLDTFIDDDALPMDAPVLILFAGLAGGSSCSYIHHCIKSAHEAGMRSIVVNGRGTASSPVYTPQLYSASYTEDVRLAVNDIRRQFPNALLFAIGWSLGSNILINYLAEEGKESIITAAASLCNPFDLVRCDQALKEGFFGKVYDSRLVGELVKISREHMHLFDGYDVAKAMSAVTVRDFDDAITRVTFGWKTVDDYYRGSSCADRIHDIAIPLLCIQAADDPICLASSIPRDAIESNDNCILTITPWGGHLGWVTNKNGLFGAPWTNDVVLEWITAVIDVKNENKYENNTYSTVSSHPSTV